VGEERSIWWRLWRRWDTRLCLLVVAAYCALAAYGEVVYRLARAADRTPAYNVVREDCRYVPPAFARLWSSAPRPAGQPLYVLGSDNLGRDVASRLVQGTRIAFHVGIVTSLIAIPLGVLLGCLGGYFGGRADSVVVWLCATVASMPGLLFILAIAMVVGQGLLGVYLGIGLTTWVGVCRNVRAEVMKHRGRAYVQAARVLGFGHARIMFRHILPNVAHIVLIAFSIRFPASVATEVFISFLGIGVQGEPSWGIMINNARLRLWQGVWWEMTFVTLAIFALVLVFNHLADALRDLLDPALRTEAG
jgi:peptide/nickel transport system permease protein